ncbi:MAG TPA: amino acid permease [Polyangiaceae bacterium]|nr:amino acid permease [Polyangiaceae bacterium]
MARAQEPVSYQRALGPFSATMAVVGGIIGSGIFVTPAQVAARAGSGALALGVWVLGGAVALAGAFCFGELGRRRPRAGGTYVYVREAFGPLPAFLYAWALLLVIGTGAIAASAVACASYAAPLVGLGPGAVLPLAAGSVVALTAINYVGVRAGALVQNLFTLLKLAALAALIVAGLGAPEAAGGWASPAGAALAGAPAAGGALAGAGAPAGGGAALAVATALVPVLFTYGGWQQTNHFADELVDAGRGLPRALVLGVAIVIAVYLLANLTYLRALGPAGLAASAAPAADAMRARLGEAGARLIAAGIAASSFGFLNLTLLSGPRVYQTMAADGAFLPALARLSPRFRTPGAALAVQGAWALVLLATSGYGQLLDYVVFCDWLFFGLAALSLFVLRRRDRAAGAPEPPAAFRVPGYPLVPAAFAAAAAYVVVGSVASNPKNALLGALILALGVPVFFYYARRARPPR